MNGIDCFFEGMRLIFRPGIRPYVLIPFVINAFVFAVILAWGIVQFDTLTGWITGMLPDWASFLAGFIAALAAIVIFVVFLFLFAIVANLIASPFYALLSERVEEAMTGKRPETSANLAVIAIRAFGREIAKLLYYLPRLIGIFILTLIPVINIASPVLWLLFGAWMLAIQYTDYGADNNGVSFRDLRDRLGRHRGQSILFGLMAYIALAIPLVNLILMPASVAGGTVFWATRLRREG